MTKLLTSRQTAHDVAGRTPAIALQPLKTLKTMTAKTTIWCLLGVVGFVPSVAAAQPGAPVESPWLPWLGCWQLVEETISLAPRADTTGPLANRVVVCLEPVGTTAADLASVDVTTMAGGEPVLVETLRADGEQHPVEEAACTGWRRNSWSGDGARLFTRAALTCDNEDGRRVSGVGLITSATTWLDIQLVTSGARGEITVRRYRRASASTAVDAGATSLPDDVLNRARRAARLASISELTVQDVIEAGAAVDTAVVEAMLVETRASFPLDSRDLIRLDDGGVPGEVIDLMVALSFPDEFVVDRPGARTAASSSNRGGGGGGFADQLSPYGYDQWYPYYASPFGYYYGWSPYSSLYYLGPAASYVIVSDGGVPDARDGRFPGRAYQGRGYSQIGVREPTTDRRAQPRDTGGNITSSQGASRGGGSSGGRSRGGSSSGGQATPGGYSRGGSSGRTATPRDR
jgi:hypothetical protein